MVAAQAHVARKLGFDVNWESFTMMSMIHNTSEEHISARVSVVDNRASGTEVVTRS